MVLQETTVPVTQWEAEPVDAMVMMVVIRWWNEPWGVRDADGMFRQDWAERRLTDRTVMKE